MPPQGHTDWVFGCAWTADRQLVTCGAPHPPPLPTPALFPLYSCTTSAQTAWQRQVPQVASEGVVLLSVAPCQAPLGVLNEGELETGRVDAL